MPLLTERALKRRKSAVIVIESTLKDVNTGSQDVEFEWFNKPDAAQEWMDGWTAFTTEDVETYTELDGEDPAMAYMTILIPDTETMEVGSVVISPDTAETQQWRDDTTADITALYEKPEDKPKAKAVVKPRRVVKAKGVTRGAVFDNDDDEDEAPKSSRRVVGRVRKFVPEAEDDE